MGELEKTGKLTSRQPADLAASASRRRPDGAAVPDVSTSDALRTR